MSENITKIPAPRTPLIDENSGDMTPAWYRFFYNIFITLGEGTGILPVNRGGTGQSEYTNGQLLIGNSTTTGLNKNTLTPLGGIEIVNGPGTITIENTGVTSVTAGPGIDIDVGVGDITISNTGVLSFSGGTTGLTPSTGTAGDVTLAGTLDVDNGGTGATTPAGARANLSAAILGANNDITSMTALNGGLSSPDFIQFDITPETVPTAEGALYWDSADSAKTLSLVMTGGNAIQQIGEEQYFRIKASATITEGQVVMFTGSVGASGGLKGAPATGLTASTAQYVMGVATENIANNGWGYVTSFGTVRGINTTGGAEAWVDGEILYLDPTVVGGLTKTIPLAPNPKVVVCAVTHAASNGSLFIRPSFGGILGQYEGDVGITSVAAYDLLQRNAANTAWVNVSPASVIAASGGAPVTKTANFTVAVTDTWIINNKSGSTCTATLPAPASFVGRALYFQNYQAQFLVSASSNVVPRAGGSAGTAILADVAGDTATLVSDGTNWITMQYTPNNVLLI